MTSPIRGVVHGTTVDLEQSPGLPDGQDVLVSLQPLPATETPLPPGEGIRRSFGAWADDAQDLDEFLEWNRRQRKQGRRELEP